MEKLRLRAIREKQKSCLRQTHDLAYFLVTLPLQGTGTKQYSDRSSSLVLAEHIFFKQKHRW